MRDGYALTACLYEPAAPKAIVLISGVLEVNQTFYTDMAQFLAAQNFAVLTYDYRGQGQSAPKRLTRSFEAGFHTLSRDFDDILAWLGRIFPGVPVSLVAHGLGGLFAVTARQNSRLSTVFAVGTQLTHDADWGPDPLTRSSLLLHRHALLPALTKLLGFFPGCDWSLGTENLPATFVHDLYRSRRFDAPTNFLQAIGIQPMHDQLRCPVMALTASDDPLCTPQALDRFFDELRNARVVKRVLEPAATAGRPVGHLGFFRKRFLYALWDMVLDWLETYQPLPTPPPPDRGTSSSFAFYAD